MDQKLELGKLSANKTKGKKNLLENTTENWEQLKYTLTEEPKYISVLRESCANGQYFQSKIDKITNILKKEEKLSLIDKDYFRYLLRRILYKVHN